MILVGRRSFSPSFHAFSLQRPRISSSKIGRAVPRPPPSTPLQCFHPRVFAFSLVHPRFVHAPFEFIVRPKTLDRPRDPLLEDARLDRPAQIRYLFAFFDTITNYVYGKLFPRRLIEEENSSRIYERFPKRSCRQYVNFSRLNWPLGQAGSLITSRLISVYSLRE